MLLEYKQLHKYIRRRKKKREKKNNNGNRNEPRRNSPRGYCFNNIYTEFKSLVVNDACVVYEDTDR